MSEMDARADKLAELRLDELDEHDERDERVGLGTEVSEADAAEQHHAVRENRHSWPRNVPFDVDPADAADQERQVDLDEDDYR